MAHRSSMGRCAGGLVQLFRQRASASETRCHSPAVSNDISAPGGAAALHSWAACGMISQPCGTMSQPSGASSARYSPRGLACPGLGASCHRGISFSTAPRAQDYYQTLGVSNSAGDAEIKKAWYSLAKKYHPDSSKEPAAKEKYHEAQKAYETLSNSQKRSTYDQVGADNYERMEAGGGGGDGPGGGGGWPFGAAFTGMKDGQMYEFDQNGANFQFMSGTGQAGQGGAFDLGDIFAQAIRQQQQRQAVRRVNVNLTLSFVEAAKGATRTVRLTKNVPQPKNVEVDVPPGVEHGMSLSLGEVEKGGKGRPAVELLVTINVERHPVFERHGENVVVHSTVDMVDACLGADITVPTMDGDKNVSIRAGAQNGDRMRLKGLGAFVLGSTVRGDQYILLRVAIPRALTQRQRELLEEFSAAGEDAASTAA